MVFRLYKDTAREGRWRLLAENNVDIIADSGEGYINKSDCLHGIDLVKRATAAPVYDADGRRLYTRGALNERSLASRILAKLRRSETETEGR